MCVQYDCEISTPHSTITPTFKSSNLSQQDPNEVNKRNIQHYLINTLEYEGWFVHLNIIQNGP